MKNRLVGGAATAVILIILGVLSAWVWPAWAVPKSAVHVKDSREIPWLDKKPAPTEPMPLGELKSGQP